MAMSRGWFDYCVDGKGLGDWEIYRNRSYPTFFVINTPLHSWNTSVYNKMNLYAVAFWILSSWVMGLIICDLGVDIVIF
jgi:hypothetical protein